MTECQLGLHQETEAIRDGRPTIICAKCGRTLHTHFNRIGART